MHDFCNAHTTASYSSHVPFRDSKLTRILQPTLSGNARVAVICTITPAAVSFEESNSTLKFASRVKKVVTRANFNEIVDDKALLQKYRNEIEQLREQLAVSTHSTDSERDTELSLLAQEKQKWEEEMHEQQLLRTALKERIDHLTKLILTSSSITPKAMMDWHPIAGSTGSTAVSASSLLSSRNPKKDAMSASADQLHGLNADIVSKTKENAQLRNSLELRDKRILELEQLVTILQTGSSETKESAITETLRNEVRNLKHINQELEIVVEEQERQIASVEKRLKRLQLTLPAPQDTDTLRERVNELEDEHRKDKEIIADLREAARANDLSMFERIEQKAAVSNSSGDSGGTLLTELKAEIQKERTIRADLEERSSERIANLETELTITRAQLYSKRTHGLRANTDFPEPPPSLVQTSSPQLYTPDILKTQLEDEFDGGLKPLTMFDTPRSLSVNHVLVAPPPFLKVQETDITPQPKRSSIREAPPPPPPLSSASASDVRRSVSTDISEAGQRENISNSKNYDINLEWMGE